MDITKQPQRIISFCTGIRGLETGLELAGITIQPVVYIENEAWLCANLVAGMEAGILASTAIFTDAKQFDGRPFRGKIHGITGGYPCPGFSVAGTGPKGSKSQIYRLEKQYLDATVEEIDGQPDPDKNNTTGNHQEQSRKRLNPRWVCMLQGMDFEKTFFVQSAMQWCQNKPQ